MTEQRQPSPKGSGSASALTEADLIDVPAREVVEVARKLFAKLQRTEAELRRAREALKPFAEFAEAWNDQRRGDSNDRELFTLHLGPKRWISLMLSDCREARAALGEDPSR